MVSVEYVERKEPKKSSSLTNVEIRVLTQLELSQTSIQASAFHSDPVRESDVGLGVSLEPFRLAKGKFEK